MRKILIYGYYGYGNFGDDLFVLISKQLANNKLQLKPIYIGYRLQYLNGEYIKAKSRFQRLLHLLRVILVYRKVLFFGGGEL